MKKVQQLKKKILDELNCVQRDLQTSLQRDLSAEDYAFAINCAFALIQLEKFLQEDGSFMHEIAMYSEQDIVIYNVANRDLCIWLQDRFNFVERYLMLASERNFNVFAMLNDKYFGGGFTSVIERALFEKEQSEGDKAKA